MQAVAPARQVSKSIKFHNRIVPNLRYYSQIAYFEALYIYLLPTWKHFIPVPLEYDPAGHGVHTDPPVIKKASCSTLLQRFFICSTRIKNKHLNREK